jgi:hypothetical protein
VTGAGRGAWGEARVGSRCWEQGDEHGGDRW